MTSKLRVMTVVGTRPEIVRLSQLIKLIDEHAEHLVVHTGQNSTESLSDVFFSDLALRDPDVFVKSDSSTFAAFCATTFPSIEKEISRFRPEAFIVLGDTNSALTSIVAKKHGVPVYHCEAGNRSFDSNVPEELNRRLVDQVSDFNIVYSEFARQNLLNEGYSQRFVFKSGSPMAEVIAANREQIAASSVLEKLNLESRSYLLVSLHRQENIDHPRRLTTALESLDAAKSHFDKRIVLSAHPRLVDKAGSLLSSFEEWNVAEPFGFIDYMKLQSSAFCVISDSGSISEEAAALGFPAVTLRDSMERQEALEMGILPMAGLESGQLLTAVEFAVSLPPRQSPADYRDCQFALRVWNLILSTARLATQWTGKRSFENS